MHDYELADRRPVVADRRPVVMVLPAHDEEATLADVVLRAPREVHGHPVEVVVVDDGSTDGTAALARAAGATVHSLGRNRGLGAAVRAGVAWGVERRAAAVAFLDADGEYAPEELADLVAPIIEDRADYVIGSRFAGLHRDMRPYRWFGNRVLTLGMKLLVQRWGIRGLSDGQSGYRALSAAAAAHAEIVHDFNYAQVLTLDLVAKGYRYAEVPISYRFRRHGRSFVRLGPYLRRVVPAIWRELRTTTEPAGVLAPDATMDPVPVLAGDAPATWPLRNLGPGVAYPDDRWTLSTTTASGSRAMSAGSRSCSRTRDRSTPS